MDVDSVAVEVDEVVVEVDAVAVDVVVAVEVAADVDTVAVDVDTLAVEVDVGVAAVDVDEVAVELDFVAVEVDEVAVELDFVAEVDVDTVAVDVGDVDVDVDEVAVELDFVAVEVDVDTVAEVETLAVAVVDEVVVDVEVAVDVPTAVVVDISAAEIRLSEDSTSGTNGTGRLVSGCCEPAALCLSAIMLRIFPQTRWADDSCVLRALCVWPRLERAHLTFDKDLACASDRDVEARALFALIPMFGIADIDSIMPVNTRQMRIAAPQRPRNTQHPPRRTWSSMYPVLGNLMCRSSD